MSLIEHADNFELHSSLYQFPMSPEAALDSVREGFIAAGYVAEGEDRSRHGIRLMLRRDDEELDLFFMKPPAAVGPISQVVVRARVHASTWRARGLKQTAQG